MSIPVYPSSELIESPYDFYAMLREQAPAHRLEGGEVIVTRWEDVERVVLDTATFSNLIGPGNPQILGGEGVGGDDRGPWALPFSDDPEHTAQRRLCRSLVSRDWLAWAEPVVGRLADELIDAIAPRGEAEFRSEFAELLPRRVVMEMFGFPRADESRLVEWSKGPGPVGSRLASEADRDAELQRRRELAEYFEAAIADRHARPGDDYLSELVAEQVARDGELDLPYQLAEITNLFAAGNVTTAHMLASTMRFALDRPDDLQRVIEDRSLIPPLLEESMRLECPVQWLQRVATRDCEIAGTQIAAGTIVLIVWGSASRDAARFERPDEFDLDRPDLTRKQIAFGYGSHRCIGAPLARLEGRVALDRVLTRLPGLRAHPGRRDDTHLPAPNQRAPTAVHIAFDPT